MEMLTGVFQQVWIVGANPKKLDLRVMLVFFFAAAKVTLLGWRLNSMLDDLACHRITRVWKLSGELAGRNREVAWISEMFVFPADDDVFEEYSSTAAPVTPGTSQLN